MTNSFKLNYNFTTKIKTNFDKKNEKEVVTSRININVILTT